ncbi:MAG: hypothetical protein Q3Y08_11230, partial [Butyricicoccus sp.]|nr:hypothetical protein [Butyricicoccus sp.]
TAGNSGGNLPKNGFLKWEEKRGRPVNRKKTKAKEKKAGNPGDFAKDSTRMVWREKRGCRIIEPSKMNKAKQDEAKRFVRNDKQMDLLQKFSKAM